MKSIFWVIPFALLSGCAAAGKMSPPAQQGISAIEQPQVNDFSEIHYLDLNSNEKNKRRDVIGHKTQMMQIPSGASPVMGYKLPQGGAYSIQVASLVNRKRNSGTVFYPEIALLNGQYKVIRKLSEGDMQYEPRYFLTPESIGTEFQVMDTSKTQFMVVYTTDLQRNKTTRLLNEAKAYAETRGQVAPPVADIDASHINSGELLVELTPIDIDHLKAQASAVNQDDSLRFIPLAARTQATESLQTRRFIENTQQQIQSELAKGEVSKALDLRNQAQAIAEQVERTFIEAYGKPSGELKLPDSPGTDASPMEKTRHYFESGIITAMKSGDSRQALKLVDDAKRLALEADSAF